MITKDYKGRKIKVRKGREWGTAEATVNGVSVHAGPDGTDQEKCVRQIEATIDHIDREPVNGDRWPAHWYAFGTYTLCESGHPVALGSRCKHSWCRQQFGVQPFRRPVWVSVGSHRARHTLHRIAGKTQAFGVWEEGGHPRGDYYCVAGRHAEALAGVKGITLLASRPNGGRGLFRRWP